MATQESQYWKFLEENPGSTLTFEEWQKHISKKLFGFLKNITNTKLDDLEDELEEFESVRIRIESEGFDYCFKHYSSFPSIEDSEFHELRERYLKSSKQLEDYVSNKIEDLIDRISKHQDNE